MSPPAAARHPDEPRYRSFWMAGFEGADHVNRHGVPLDMARASGHLDRLDEDYARLGRLGLRTVRESIGWRLSERAGGEIELGRAIRMVRAAQRHGLQPLWTLMHYGTPPDVSLFDDALVGRFARFAARVARTLRPLSPEPPIYTLVNEISFLAWTVSETDRMRPYQGSGRRRIDSTCACGMEVKRRLVRATLAAREAVLDADPRARFLQVEPVVHVVAPADRPALAPLARQVRDYQWQVWDLLAGRSEPALGGREATLDLIGVNHYAAGQWEVGSERRLHWHLRDPRRQPLGTLLRETWERYGRPLLLAETSHVGAGRAAWLDEIAAEVQRVRREGVPVGGLCLYPIVDRPDWDDPAHWHRSGLWDVELHVPMPPAPVEVPPPGPTEVPEPGPMETPVPSPPEFEPPPPDFTPSPATPQRPDIPAPEHPDLPPPPQPAPVPGPPPPEVEPHPEGREPAPMRLVLHRGYARTLLRWQRRLPGPVPSPGSTMPDLIVFSHLRWDFVYQRPQHLLSRLARHFRVLVVEEPERGGGAPHFRRSVPCDNVEVLRPVTPVEAPGFHDDQLSVLQPLLAEHLRREAIEDYLAWFYTPMALPLLSQLRPRAIVYDCMDELSAFKDAPRQMRQRESALLKSADLVLTGGPSLYEAKRALHPSVHCLPSAVDAQHYAPAHLVPDPETEALQAGIPHPRLGFFGVIDERLDLDLLARLAEARPAWQIVMVGPVVKIDPARLPRRPNLHWLGGQPYRRLPQLVAGWDLCLLPFALNEATRFISPTKTLEYMAAEKPVVSTPVRDVADLYGDVVRIGGDAPAFIAACEEALAESAPQRAERLGAMRASVSRFSWDRTADTIHALISEALDRRAETPARPALPPLTVEAPRSVRHLILGAGPTGLATAWHLGRAAPAASTVLIERESRVGGGCRPVSDRGFLFDRADAAMFDGDAQVQALYEALLGEQQLHWPAGATGLPYPLHGGLQALMESFLPQLACELALNTAVVQVSPARRSVRLDDGRLLRWESLVSTLPLPALVAACGDEAPAAVQASARGLRQGSVRWVHLGVARERLAERLWLDFPGAHTVFRRLFAQGHASPHCSPPGGFGLSAEVPYAPEQPLSCDGAALVERVVADCRRVGLLREDDRLITALQVDVPCARVVDDAARAAQVGCIRDWLSACGIVLAGRYGAWEPASPGEHPFAAGRRAAAQLLGTPAAGASRRTAAEAGGRR